MSVAAGWPLNAVCPYYTMYSLDFPLRFLSRSGRRGDWVLDPFCGRGTTNFAARMLGLGSLGIDSSPIAVAIACAKLIRVSPNAVIERAHGLLGSNDTPSEVPDDPFWKLAFAESTFLDICRLRDAVGRAPTTPIDKMLRAIVLGALHGPLGKGSPIYLSNQAPRTFAPKPRYSLKYWQQHGMQPPQVNTLEVIVRRARRFLTMQPPAAPGVVVSGDSRRPEPYSHGPKCAWVITSPPYYGMRTYVPDQWLRNWFVGGPANVPYSHPIAELSHRSPESFTDQLRLVWQHAHSRCRPGAKLICRFGGINDRRADPNEILKGSLLESGWRITTIKSAGTATDGRRQAAQFGERGRSKPRSEYDVYAVAQ